MKLLLILLTLACATPCLARDIWSGDVAGSTIQWTTQNLTISSGKATLFDAKKIWNEDLAKMRTLAADKIDSQEEVTLLSVVGPVVSYKDATYCDCGGAHPSANTALVTMNTQKPGKACALTDFFSEGTLLTALLKDKLVQTALTENHETPPVTLKDLLKLLPTLNSPDKDYEFTAYMLGNFAFHHIEGDKVAVRIGLPYSTEASRGNLTQLGLLLPIPETLKAMLSAAASKQNGFLMQNAPKGVTTFHYVTHQK